jgi:hypothetical protein
VVAVHSVNADVSEPQTEIQALANTLVLSAGLESVSTILCNAAKQH